MTGFPPWFLRLLFASGMMATALFVVRPMSSYRALAVGADAAMVGFVAAAFGVLPMLVAVPVGRWVDRSREGGFIVGGTSLIAASCGLLAVTTRVWQVAALNALLGLGHLGFVLGSQTLLASGSAEAEHDRRFGLFTMTAAFGQLAGPLAGGFIAARSGSLAVAGDVGGERVPDTTWSLLTAAVVAAVAGLVVVRLGSPEPWNRPGRQDRPEPGTSLRDIAATRGVPRALLASLSIVASTDLLIAYLPVLGQQRGISVELVGVLLAVRASASMIARLWVHDMVRHLGRRRLLSASMLVSTAGLVALPASGQVAVLAAVLALVGFCLGIGTPLTMTWVVQLVPPRVRGTALALRLSGNRVGQVAVPAASGLIAGLAGLAGVFGLLGGLLGVGALGVLLRQQAPAGRSRDWHHGGS